jgi:hypothetical protein
LVVIDAEPVGCVQLRNPPLAYGYMYDKTWSLLVSLLFIVLLCNQGTLQVLSVTRHRLPVRSLHIFRFRKCYHLTLMLQCTLSYHLYTELLKWIRRWECSGI